MFPEFRLLILGPVFALAAMETIAASAVAVDHAKGAFGLANELPTETEARQRAIDNCSKRSNDCKIIASTELPGHGAFFAARDGWGVALGKSSGEAAETEAILQCKAKFVNNCKSVKTWLDTGAPSVATRDVGTEGIQGISKISPTIVPQLKAHVTAVKSHRMCIDGCKDFEVACTWAGEVGRADRANGIAERHAVALQFLRLGGTTLPGGLVISNDRKWHEETHAVQFTLANGSWKSSVSEFSQELVASRCGKPK